MLTAYSKMLGKERDAKVILEAHGYDTKKDPFLRSVPDVLRVIVNQDVLCPGCYSEQISLVKGGINEDRFITQPHFRTPGNQSHNSNCSYLARERIERGLDHPRYLHDAADKGTRKVAKLISKAIEIGAINEKDFSDFRGWSFDQQKNASWSELLVNSNQLYMFWGAARATINGHLAAQYKVPPKKCWEDCFAVYICPDAVEKIKPLDISRHDYMMADETSLNRVFKKCAEFGVPDLRRMSSYYKEYLDLKLTFFSISRHTKSEFKSIKSSYWLSTFLSTLLYKSDWNAERAKKKIERIESSTNTLRQTTITPNVIGTNLFDDLPARLTICHANNNIDLLDNTKDYKIMREFLKHDWLLKLQGKQ